MRLLRILDPSGRRWPVAVRAALSIGLAVSMGWAAGDLPAGLMATIGAFTSLYASDRPYVNRSKVLAAIAVSFACVVSLGVWSQQLPSVAVPLVVVIAMAATYLCNSLRIGPPGAYMFALACAAGTAVPVAHMALWQAGLLVLAGGAISWLVHMAGAAVSPRGPERAAVAAAARAVARLADAAEGTERDNARHSAAMALHEAWVALVTLQAARPRPNGTLIHLRALNRELHLIFATCVSASHSTDSNLNALVARARSIGVLATARGEGYPPIESAQLPLGRPGTARLFLNNLRLRSPATIAAARVGIAVACAGAIGLTFDLARAYWAMAAAVLVLHQGLDWTRTLRRGLERMGGTLAGLCVAGALLAVHPAGLWLVVTIICLQFLVEMLVTRAYAVAVIFVTAIALIIASGGHPVADPAGLLWARGVDTVIGCVVGLMVLLVVTPRSSAGSIRVNIDQTLMTIQATLAQVATGSVTTDAALRVRRDLQHTLFALVAAYETQMGGTPRQRYATERMWPTVVAAQRLGYQVLATCWSLEETAKTPTPQGASHLITETEFEELNNALSDIIAAVRAGIRYSAPSRLTDFLQLEIRDLADSLVAETD